MRWIPIRSKFNADVCGFVDFLLQSNDLYLILTPKIIEETAGTLVYVINREFDKVFQGKYRSVRKAFRDHCLERLEHLEDIARKPKPKKINPNEVRDFYLNLLKNPKTKEKLVRLKQKKQRKSLTPEKSDIKILAETIALKKNYGEIHLIHRDSDYGWFSEEIENTFGVIVNSVEDLKELEDELISKMQQ